MGAVVDFEAGKGVARRRHRAVATGEARQLRLVQHPVRALFARLRCLERHGLPLPHRLRPGPAADLADERRPRLAVDTVKESIRPARQRHVARHGPIAAEHAEHPFVDRRFERRIVGRLHLGRLPEHISGEALRLAAGLGDQRGLLACFRVHEKDLLASIRLREDDARPFGAAEVGDFSQVRGLGTVGHHRDVRLRRTGEAHELAPLGVIEVTERGPAKGIVTHALAFADGQPQRVVLDREVDVRWHPDALPVQVEYEPVVDGLAVVLAWDQPSLDPPILAERQARFVEVLHDAAPDGPVRDPA